VTGGGECLGYTCYGGILMTMTSYLPDDGAARHKPLVVDGVVVGPFEEEEEGTGIVSDVVKVQGEDQSTPGPLI